MGTFVNRGPYGRDCNRTDNLEQTAFGDNRGMAVYSTLKWSKFNCISISHAETMYRRYDAPNAMGTGFRLVFSGGAGDAGPIRKETPDAGGRGLSQLRRPSTARNDVKLNGPVFRGDCSAAGRPCPFVGCKYHLAGFFGEWIWKKDDEEIIDIVFHLAETCILDIIEKSPGGVTEKEIALYTGLPAKEIDKILRKALDHVYSSNETRRIWNDCLTRLAAHPPNSPG